MSEEVARAIGDVLAENAALRVEIQAALSDNAALVRIARAAIDCLRGLLYQDGTDTAIKRADRSMYGFESLLTAEHPGAALLSELEAARAELAAARELKEWTRKWQSVYVVSREMIAAMDAMDAATKARSE